MGYFDNLSRTGPKREPFTMKNVVRKTLSYGTSRLNTYVDTKFRRMMTLRNRG